MANLLPCQRLISSFPFLISSFPFLISHFLVPTFSSTPMHSYALSLKFLCWARASFGLHVATFGSHMVLGWSWSV